MLFDKEQKLCCDRSLAIFKFFVFRIGLFSLFFFLILSSSKQKASNTGVTDIMQDNNKLKHFFNLSTSTAMKVFMIAAQLLNFISSIICISSQSIISK